MADRADNVTPLRPTQDVTDKGTGNGGGFDERLRTLEILVARIDERVVAIQKDITENIPKKNDVTGLKVWILGGVLSGIVIAASHSGDRRQGILHCLARRTVPQ